MFEKVEENPTNLAVHIAQMMIDRGYGQVIGRDSSIPYGSGHHLLEAVRAILKLEQLKPVQKDLKAK